MAAIDADVPKQQNVYDCGLYVLEFLLFLLRQPDQFSTLGLTSHQAWFDQSIITHRRVQMRELVSSLLAEGRRREQTDVAILLKDEGLRARVQEALTSEPPPPVEENVSGWNQGWNQGWNAQGWKGWNSHWSGDYRRLKAFYNELNFLLQEYRRVTQLVKPITANLLKPHLDHLDLQMRPGMVTLSWTSMNLDSYLKSVWESLAQLEQLICGVNDIMESLVPGLDECHHFGGLLRLLSTKNSASPHFFRVVWAMGQAQAQIKSALHIDRKNTKKEKVDREDDGPEGLTLVTSRAAERSGRLNITGRYHRLPKKMQDDYESLPQVLGTGYNGEVKLARCRHTGAKFAVKAFKLRGVSKEKRKELESEAEIFLAMDHPHVAALTDVYESEEQLFLVMECMQGGELFDRVVQRKRFTEKDAARAIYQMLLAVNYIHSHDIVHRDIKLENFLYEAKDSDHLKLIDFGFSKIWHPNTTMAVSCGTLAYVAPEVLEKSYTSQCDLWSLGVVAFVLLFGPLARFLSQKMRVPQRVELGYMPFSGAESKQIRDIKEGNFTKKPAIWGKASENCKDFVQRLLVVDPKRRLSAAEALEHRWLQAHDHHEHVIDQAMIEDLCNFAKVSVFRRACLGVLSWSLGVEERKQVRDAFLQIDKDRSGTITINEFKQAVEANCEIDDETLEKAFKALDANHKDEVNYHEFLAAMVASRISLHDHLLKVAFRRFDVDNSGTITVENLREVLGETFEGNEVQNLLSELNLKNDGAISYEEWIEYLKGGMGDVQPHHADAAARVIDKTMEKQQEETGRPTSKTVRTRGTSEGSLQATSKTRRGVCCLHASDVSAAWHQDWGSDGRRGSHITC
eukprot:symbB.v1.2.026471.t1/scaffold2649.1/size74057/3